MKKQVADFLLIVLWVYAAGSKLLDMDTFRGQLFNQTFSHGFAAVLLYALPAAELLAALLLSLPLSQYYGRWLSLVLLVLFTGYIGLVLLHFWPRVPCSCGGILSHLGWKTHLFFNMFFIAVTWVALSQTGEAENLRKE